MPAKTKDNQGPAQGVATRIAASRTLELVFAQRLTLDEALTRIIAKYRVEDDDRRLVHAICASVFRNLPAIDALLRRLMNRDIDPTPAPLHQLLRVGVAQLLYLEVAAHAAVHATVSAAGSMKLSSRKSLVNAVLRSVQREKEAAATSPAQPQNDLAQLPQWLSSRWIKNYGESDAATFATLMRQEAPLDLTIKDAHASHEWAAKLEGEVVLPGTVRVHRRAGQITSWPGFEEGAWWVQDVASSLPVRLLGDVAGKRIADICAAPGGKTMQLAAQGAQVTAIDASVSRMTRLSENITRLRMTQSVETAIIDARDWQPGTSHGDQVKALDAVVIDAPCSATGTLRRHPELPWIHSENQVRKMTLIQADLLRRACDWVDSGGVILYITCSMEVEEGEDQVESLLAQRKDFIQITDIPAVVHPFLKPGRHNLGYRTNPAFLGERGGMDGFYMALLKKI